MYYTTSEAYILSMEMLGLGFGFTLAVGASVLAVAAIVSVIRSNS